MFLVTMNIGYFNFCSSKIFTLVLVPFFSFILFLVLVIINFGSYKYFRVYV